MGWYDKKILKTAAVGDLLQGMANAQVSEYPPEGELSDEQKKTVRGLVSSYSSPMSKSDQLDLFLRYPQTLDGYYTLFSLSDYSYRGFNPNTNKMIQAWEHLRERNLKEPITYVPLGLPLFIYSDMFANGEVTAELAATVFENPKWYPPSVNDKLIKLFPEVYKAINSGTEEEQAAQVRNFVQAPSANTFSLFKSMTSRQMHEAVQDDEYANKNPFGLPFQRSLYRFSLNLGMVEQRIKEDVGEKTREYITMTGAEMAEAMQLMLDAAENKEEAHLGDGVLVVYGITDPDFGVIPLFHIGAYRVTRKTIENIRDVCERFLKANFDLSCVQDLDDYKDEYTRLKELVQVTDGLPVVLSAPYDGNAAWVVGEWYQSQARYHSGPEGTAANILSISFLPRRGSTTELEQWYFSEKEKAKDKDAFYLSFMTSPACYDITNRVDGQMYALYAQNAQLITASEFLPGHSYAYDQIPEFELKTAMKIWSDIPPNMRITGGKEAPSRFVMCSGLFPRSVVLERALRYPSDTVKIVENIKTLEGDDKELIDYIRKQAAEKKANAIKTVKDRMPQLIENDSVIVKEISDFPEIFQYASDAIHRLSDSEKKVYDYHRPDDNITATDIAIDRLSKCVIMLMNAYTASEILGSQTLTDVGLSPESVGGTFCCQYGPLSDENDVILVYMGRQKSIQDEALEKTISDIIGVPVTNPFNRVSEEGTFWHEVAHGIVNYSNPGGDPNPPSKEDITTWIKKPTELLAIQYGNLAFIKRRLLALFSNGIPENGIISSGLMEHLKSEIIQTFSWEFQGMRKEEALMEVEDAFEDFSSEVRGMQKSMSKQEVVELLVDVFSEFYLGRLLRGKVETDVSTILEEMHIEPGYLIVNREQVVIPEQYEYNPPGKRDKYIAELEGRADYQQFLQDAQRVIDREVSSHGGVTPDYIRRYVHKSDPTKLRVPWELSDLLTMVYGPPGTMSSIDISSTNHLFSSIIPTEIKVILDRLVRQNQTMLEQVTTDEDRVITPDEAEETGKFIAEMDREYGPDWVWLATQRQKWFKRASDVLNPKRKKAMALPSVSNKYPEQEGAIHYVDKAMTPETKRKLDEGQGRSYLGHGQFGIAYDMPNGAVEKVTTDFRDIKNAKAILKMQRDYGGALPFVTFVYRADTLQEEPPLFRLVLEKVNPAPQHYGSLLEQYIKQVYQNRNFLSAGQYPHEHKVLIEMVTRFVNSMDQFGMSAWDLKVSNFGMRDQNLIIIDIGALHRD